MEIRFWEKVNKDGPTIRPELGPCWVFTGAPNENGYGVLSKGSGGGNVLAHRYSYTLHYGELAPKVFACHKCDNPPCVRPDHLFAGTHAANMADSIFKGRFQNPINGVVNKAKTHCLRGHGFTIENTLHTRNQRQCRTCNREKMRTKRGGFGSRPTAQEINRTKTHCAKGHEFTPENTYTRKNGWRSCRQCHLDRMASHRK